MEWAPSRSQGLRTLNENDHNALSALAGRHRRAAREEPAAHAGACDRDRGATRAARPTPCITPDRSVTPVTTGVPGFARRRRVLPEDSGIAAAVPSAAPSDIGRGRITRRLFTIGGV